MVIHLFLNRNQVLSCFFSVMQGRRDQESNSANVRNFVLCRYFMDSLQCSENLLVTSTLNSLGSPLQSHCKLAKNLVCYRPKNLLLCFAILSSLQTIAGTMFNICTIISGHENRILMLINIEIQNKSISLKFIFVHSL